MTRSTATEAIRVAVKMAWLAAYLAPANRKLIDISCEATIMPIRNHALDALRYGVDFLIRKYRPK